jgi:tRNA (guanine10-N2)-dimethyltransferase
VVVGAGTVTVGYVEPSGESPELARAEATAAAESLGGGAPPADAFELEGLVAVSLPGREAVLGLAQRIALARRCLEVVHPGEAAEGAASLEGSDGRRAVFRRIGRSEGSSDSVVRSAGRAYRTAGGAIDLESPERTYWIATSSDGRTALLREVARVDRAAFSLRAMPRLPFRRPVSMAPRLARAAANLARIRPGDRVLDPFLGTGALLAEAALLGGRAYGIDRDPTMVRGALRNFAQLGVEAAELVEGDAGEATFGDPAARFEAVLTDPPYGRASGTGGESAAAVWRRVGPRWADRVVPGGRVVAVVPPGFGSLEPPWDEEFSVRVRVHRSLTREFRVYRRDR